MKTACTPGRRVFVEPRPVQFGDSLTVFFPAYNDAGSLPSLVEQCFAILSETVPDFEVLVVNDGSTDETRLVLAELQQRFGPALRVIHHEANRGYGGALRSGFANATRDWVFYTDGDGQYDVGDLPALLRQVTPDVGFVNGYKISRSDRWHRIWIGRVYNAVVRWAFGIRIRDVDCDFRLIRRSLLADCNLRSTSGAICVELVKMLQSAGAAHAETPVRHLPRLHGRSQFFRLPSLVRTFRQLAMLYWHHLNTSRLRRLS